MNGGTFRDGERRDESGMDTVAKTRLPGGIRRLPERDDARGTLRRVRDQSRLRDAEGGRDACERWDRPSAKLAIENGVETLGRLLSPPG